MDHNTLRYKNMNVHYYTSGNPENDAIFMLHPAFADYHIFDQQIDFISKDYFVVAIDMIAHGKSEAKNTSACMGDMPEVTVLIMDLLEIKKAHFLGVSLGSLVAQGIAYLYPDKAKSVTVVGGYSIHKENELILKAQKKEMGKWVRYILFSLEKFKKHIIETSTFTNYSRDVFQNSMRNFKRRLLMYMRGMEKFIVDEPKDVPYPLLIVCGEYDLELATDFGKMWETIEPNARYVEIALAGHCANIDNSESFNEIYLDFLRQLI